MPISFVWFKLILGNLPQCCNALPRDFLIVVFPDAPSPEMGTVFPLNLIHLWACLAIKRIRFRPIYHKQKTQRVPHFLPHPSVSFLFIHLHVFLFLAILYLQTLKWLLYGGKHRSQKTDFTIYQNILDYIYCYHIFYISSLLCLNSQYHCISQLFSCSANS